MLSEEKEKIERMISKNTGRDLQKEIQRHLDSLIEQIISEERGDNEGTA